MRKNKFNARKCEFMGIKFDSKKEMERYILLKDKEKKGEIKDLQVQVPFELIPKNDKFRALVYKADFKYYVPDHKTWIVEDVKGYRDSLAYRTFRIKQKLMYDKFKIEVMEV